MIKTIKRGIASVGILGTGALGYSIYQQKHPKEQLPFDPSKETVAVLGSGWGAVSFLKNIDSSQYNIVVVSPRNYFLFSPLLPSTTVGTIELRSIMQPIRYITRHHARQVTFIEGECTDIDIDKKLLKVNDNTNLQVQTLVKYDKLVIACGAENATFGIPGVKENACFLKEAWDAKNIRAQLMDCIENAAFPGQSEQEIQRLLHMVVVGGGPTGVEYAAELYDFLHQDLSKWYPDIAGKIRITLVEAMPSVLPMFSKELIEYTQKQFSKPDLSMRLNTTVKQVNPKDIVVINKNKEQETIPYGIEYFILISRIIGLGHW